MTLAIDLLNEFTQEASVTRLFLEKVPFEKATFKPHKNAEELGRLALHVSEIIAWWKSCIENDSLDFIDFTPKEIKSTNELLNYFDELVIEAKAAIKNIENFNLEKEWSMKNGEEILFSMPKKQVIRSFCMNHLIHHRAQLGVYLKILDIDVPATYGPSFTDYDVILINQY
jgi:uncharacterized damage-inducible protein DinB